MKGTTFLVTVLVIMASLGLLTAGTTYSKVSLTDISNTSGRVEVMGTALFVRGGGFTLSDVCAEKYVNVTYTGDVPEGAMVSVKGWYSGTLKADEVKLMRYPQGNPQPIGCVLASKLRGTSLTVSGTVVKLSRSPWESTATLNDGNSITVSIKDSSQTVDWNVGSVINVVVYLGRNYTVEHWYDITVLSEPHT